MAAGSSIFDVTSVYVRFECDGEATSKSKGEVRGVGKIGDKVLGCLSVGWARVGSCGAELANDKLDIRASVICKPATGASDTPEVGFAGTFSDVEIYSWVSMEVT